MVYAVSISPNGQTHWRTQLATTLPAAKRIADAYEDAGDDAEPVVYIRPVSLIDICRTLPRGARRNVLDCLRLAGIANLS